MSVPFFILKQLRRTPNSHPSLRTIVKQSQTIQGEGKGVELA